MVGERTQNAQNRGKNASFAKKEKHKAKKVKNCDVSLPPVPGIELLQASEQRQHLLHAYGARGWGQKLRRPVLQSEPSSLSSTRTLLGRGNSSIMRTMSCNPAIELGFLGTNKKPASLITQTDRHNTRTLPSGKRQPTASSKRDATSSLRQRCGGELELRQVGQWGSVCG